MQAFNLTCALRNSLAMTFVAWIAVAPAVYADDYPNRPIRVILPNSAGSLVDATARIVAERMGKDLGQPMVIENQPGAGGVTGTQQLVRAPKDGYTIGMVATNHVIIPSLYKIPYDAYADVTPVMVIGNTPMVLTVNPKVKASTLQEFVTAAKARPGELTMGSAGLGTTAHLSAELMQSTTGVKFLHVPYKGQSGFTSDLLGGQIEAGFLTATVAAPLVKSGKLRALAVTTPKRSPVLPDIPTFGEAGVPNYAIDAWVMILAPAGTPKAVVTRLHDAAAKALQSKEVQDKLAEQGVDIIASSMEGADATLKQDLAKFTQLIKDAGIKPE